MLSSSTIDGTSFARYVIDGKLSRGGVEVLLTKMEINPYFLWEFPFLTKILGVTITSTDETLGEVEYNKNLNDIHVRAGNVRVQGLCDIPDDGSHAVCKPWNENEFCGSLDTSMMTLPLREYTIWCSKSIVAGVLTIQILDTNPRVLSFDEITVIKGSFLKTEDGQAKPNTYHGSPGNGSVMLNLGLIQNDLIWQKKNILLFKLLHLIRFAHLEWPCFEVAKALQNTRSITRIKPM